MLSSKINDGSLTLGILGGGQLAKMLAFEAYKMGLNVSIIEKKKSSPTGLITQNEFPGGWEDKEQLDKFIENSDVITLENEFISPEILEYCEQKREVFPSSKTISMIQDKFTQKTNFAKAGLPLPNFKKIDAIEAGKEFGNKFGYPYVMKTRTLGYDGYGNLTIRSEGDVVKAFDKFKPEKSGRKLYAESFVDFTKELAVMIVRSKSGDVLAYPCVETIQQNHICHEVIAPAEIEEKLAEKAQEIAAKCVKTIDGVGVFGIEMFLKSDGEILVNEIAPRPHNSGHYTIEACYTSQFENGIRAILDLPLGSTEMVKEAAVMINLLGEREGAGVPSDPREFLKIGKAKLHLYNKSDSRVGRKMGHFTIIGDNIGDVKEDAHEALNAFKW